MTDIESDGCEFCPFSSTYYHRHEDGHYWACDVSGRQSDTGYPPAVAPDWCPLRNGPITVTLRESND